MPSIEELTTVAVLNILALVIASRRRRRSYRRSLWVKPWLLRRNKFSVHSTLIKELQNEDPLSYKNFLRMSTDMFEELRDKISPIISKRDTHFRRSISIEERLSLTLRFLATGESFHSLRYQYRISVSSISKIVPEVCDAIYNVLRDDYIKTPETEEEWRNIASEFEQKWQFPHCIGALDGKHITINPPANTGSYFFNYKHTFSIVLLALVDANYRFRFVDVGCNGRVSDGGVFRNSKLYDCLENDKLNIPKLEPITGTQYSSNYVIVADEAFPLKPYLLKPYSGRDLNNPRRVFNYRLSRARRVVESAFGILASRFRIFYSPISLNVESTEKVVLAAIALHNWFRESGTHEERYQMDESNDGIPEEPQAFDSIGQQTGNRSSNIAQEQREQLCNFFNTDGQVHWQWKKALGKDYVPIN